MHIGNRQNVLEISTPENVIIDNKIVHFLEHAQIQHITY